MGEFCWNDLERRIRPGEFDRRSVLKALASLGLGMAVLTTSGRARAADQVSVYTWATYKDRNLYQSYVDSHGDPSISFFGDTDEAFNKLKGGYRVDLAHPCADDMRRWQASGMLKPFDESKLAHLGDFWPELATLDATVDESGKRWFVPFDWGNSSIVYRTDKVDVRDQSWSILYNDDRYKGRVAMYDSGPPAVEIAASILKYPDIFVVTDEQLVECGKLLRHQRDNVRFYWSDQSTIEQGIASGELVAAYAWNDAVQRLKKQGVPVAYMDPKEGMRTWVCGLVMMKDAPDEKLAYDFLNAFTSPEAGRYLLSSLGTGHVNKKAFDMVDPKVLDGLGIGKPAEMMKKTVFLRAVPEDRRKKYVDLYNTIKAGG